MVQLGPFRIALTDSLAAYAPHAETVVAAIDTRAFAQASLFGPDVGEQERDRLIETAASFDAERIVLLVRGPGSLLPPDWIPQRYKLDFVHPHDGEGGGSVPLLNRLRLGGLVIGSLDGPGVAISIGGYTDGSTGAPAFYWDESTLFLPFLVGQCRDINLFGSASLHKYAPSAESHVTEKLIGDL